MVTIILFMIIGVVGLYTGYKVTEWIIDFHEHCVANQLRREFGLPPKAWGGDPLGHEGRSRNRTEQVRAA